MFVDLAVVSQLSPVPVSHVERIANESGARIMAYAEEASVDFGWSAELLARAQQLAAGSSPLTHVRIGAAYSPIPSSRAMENAMLPHASDIVARIVECF